MADSSAQIFSTNFQRKFSAQIFSQIFSAALNANADSQCTNFNSNNLRVVSPLVYNIYSVVVHDLFATWRGRHVRLPGTASVLLRIQSTRKMFVRGCEKFLPALA